ncbi:hypothetical protein [Streptomyces chartreusis]|uniref:hypothetical protein n=1 Tax=Streptomyces chartreusis TaxID=1969 RepID=UPI0036BDBAB9
MTYIPDLAVAYHACRRGDLEQASRWWAETEERRRESDPAWIDVLAVDAWLARRQGEWRALVGVLAGLSDEQGAPLTAEGLDLLAAELTRPALQSQSGPGGGAASPSDPVSARVAAVVTHLLHRRPRIPNPPAILVAAAY